MRRIRVTLAASVLLLASATAYAADLIWSKDAAGKCSFVAPASLTDAPKQWIGSCQGGKANGIGMLRARMGDQAGPAFYGEMREGVPVKGVVDLDGGYRVGLFSGREIGEGDLQWQDRLDSFNLAVRAATMVSQHYAGQKNTASANYYRDVAKQLEAQVE
ncbi:hypothetical protein FXN63_00055 [Pigmentiphaga aceris]|uniref:Uncharacterized protein n=1 Tax=Pigmentiphaga aceris TaxID=1940612 RepID=A0A5C0B6G5_9BURK|nr:hypothetical protein FXN63_00055 [Pigmentiphaga aceris]